MEVLPDLCSVDFGLRTVLDNRMNGNKITQLGLCHSGASELPQVGLEKAELKSS